MYDLIKNFEELRLTSYCDIGGVATIGYGTTKYPNGTLVKLGDTCTKEQAEEWLVYHINNEILIPLNKVLKVNLNTNQKEAIVSYIYNIGINAFIKGDCLLYLNEGEIYKAAESIKICTVNGKANKGLCYRRIKEVVHFFKPAYKEEEKLPVKDTCKSSNIFIKLLNIFKLNNNQ